MIVSFQLFLQGAIILVYGKEDWKKKWQMKSGCGGLVTWGKDIILSSFLGFIWYWITSREISRLQNLQKLQLNCAFFSFTGASACVHLERFDEAIIWCDKGLAVSFNKVDEIIASKRLWSCHTPCKKWKLGTRKVHLVTVFSVNTYWKYSLRVLIWILLHDIAKKNV